MTIHSEHPFAPADRDKDAFRRLRGRLPSPVTVVATGTGRGRAGLTVSSLLLVDGDPPRIEVFVDPDSELGESLEVGARAAASVLQAGDAFLAEVFAGLAPAPGGMFTVGTWVDSDWGPRLDDRSWCGFTVDEISELGWSLRVTGTVRTVAVEAATGAAHARGRFHDLG
ncbi:flavin reductase [Aeromicrobium tamlense]|uniref:Flavin reductase n=1 Tax=Aeromicrobium tamlense TaxID=375541 RepID=A0A8I0FUN7_9ACTN|nr:flavin reductase [Aeromicrobium tamlense]MBD1270884.1 flavin reductase [Aeromicrobium tamlense]NYI38275.1 flavin reductase (DIM6/NTAB) family NADH-FMN oxidoreductase RutF [Aeromicrobium tamlense]